VVKEHVPADRLLVYDVKDGWEPLREVLGVEVPEGNPFPRLNDAAAVRKMFRRRCVLASASLAGSLLIGTALLCFVIFLHRSLPGRLPRDCRVGV
jgi:Sulfotransferase domain